MLRFFSIISIALLVHGCATTTSFQKQPSRDPISMGSSGSETITFRGVIIRILAGSKIGAHHDGLLKVPQFPYTWSSNVSSGDYEFILAASEQLRKFGYSVLGGDNILFGEDNSAKAQYQLGGVITAIYYNTYGALAGNYSEAALTVEWQLYNALERRIAFQTTTSGYRKQGGTSSAAIYLAFREALNNLLAEQQFADLLIKKESVTAFSVSSNETIPIEVRIDASEQTRLPDDIEAIFEGVVTLRVGASLATGFVISFDGYILTAAHTVSGVTSANVQFRSGLTMKAEVVRIDQSQDIALLKIPGSGYKFLPLLTDQKSGIGSEIYAIGTPFDEKLSYSVSRGVISGYRTFDGFSYIQTDASLNPGNSGGPLLDIHGQVIGIVSWKIANVGFEGLAFGVPISVVGQRLGLQWQSTGSTSSQQMGSSSIAATNSDIRSSDAATPTNHGVSKSENVFSTKASKQGTIFPNFRLKVPEAKKLSDKEILEAFRKKFPKLKNVSDERLAKMIEDKYSN